MLKYVFSSKHIIMLRPSPEFGNKVVIAGWGTTDTLQSTDHLQKTYLSIRTPGSEDCKRYPSYLQEQHLCIGGIVGDSYSPCMLHWNHFCKRNTSVQASHFPIICAFLITQLLGVEIQVGLQSAEMRRERLSCAV
jgi:hypothetical protein